MYSTRKIAAIAVTFSIATGFSGMAFADQATSTATTAAATVSIATTTAAASPALALPKAARFSGIVSGADASGFTLTNSKGTSVSVAPAAGAVVLVNEEPSALASLLNGMQSSVYGSWAGGTSTISASVISAETASAGGVITNVNGMGFTVTSGTNSILVSPAGNADVIIDRIPSSTSNLVSGMTVNIYGTWNNAAHSAITGTVIIAANAGVGGKIGQVGNGQFVVVNDSGKQITVDTSSATALLKGGVPSTFASILDGAPVDAYGTWTDASQSTLNAATVYINGKGDETSSSGWCYTFYKNMRVGSQGADVYNLQVALNQSGFTVPETSSYDQSTASAVSGFQQKFASDILTPNGLTYGTGFVGAATRSKLNELYQCSDPINGSTGGSQNIPTNGDSWQQ